MRIRVIDFETTGMPEGAGGAAVCEVGRCDVIGRVVDETTGLREWSVDTDSLAAVLCNPGRPIPPEIRAIHHIADADVADAIAATVALDGIGGEHVDAVAAHNAKFEQAFYPGGSAPWICTYKVALRLWPEAPSHSNQVLRYWLGMELPADLAMPPHRAGPDAFVTAHILARELNLGTASFDDMVRWSAGPALLPRITFGKYRGSKWEAAPSDYLSWIADKSDMDADVKANARHHLKARAKQ